METIDYGTYINEAQASVHSHLKRGHQDMCHLKHGVDTYVNEVWGLVHMSFEALASVRMSFEARSHRYTCHLKHVHQSFEAWASVCGS